MAAPKSGVSKPHEPTDKSRAEVGALVSFGITHEQIASHLHIDADTLTKHYRDELDNAAVRANAEVANRLFRKATEQDDLGAMTFWLKTRARWRTKDDDAAKKLESAVEKLLLKGLED